jgi:hypothetical protein
MVFVVGALPPRPHKELSFLDLVFGVLFLKKGNKKRLTTQNTKEPKKTHTAQVWICSYGKCNAK